MSPSARSIMDEALAADDWRRWSAAGVPGLLSIVIPAYNEEDVIAETIAALQAALRGAQIAYELVIVDDNSRDRTAQIVQAFAAADSGVRLVANHRPNGFGNAVKRGLRAIEGDSVVITMADLSDRPEDIVNFHRALSQGGDCVFGSRFVRGATVENYPAIKKAMNRVANLLIQVALLSSYNDFTNGFKCYRRHVIADLQPLVSTDFNLTVEMSVKTILRGYNVTVVPNHWRDRTAGTSSFKILPLMPKYAFSVLYAWSERVLLGRKRSIEP